MPFHKQSQLINHLIDNVYQWRIIK